MPIALQISMVIAVIFYLLIIVVLLKKGKLAFKYSLLWLFSGVIMLILSLFPRLLIKFASLCGFAVVSNAIFAMVLFLLIILQVYMTTVISDFSLKIKKLTQELAIANKRLEELEKK